jgi:Hsp70 protein
MQSGKELKVACLQAVLMACAEAGLQVIRLISSPAAAAIAHVAYDGMFSNEEREAVVYDFGGGAMAAERWPLDAQSPPRRAAAALAYSVGNVCALCLGALSILWPHCTLR